ncbi:MAG: hypothetical protein ABR905_01250 [Terracidiphilus sp.]|jgi:hypothetical protein
MRIGKWIAVAVAVAISVGEAVCAGAQTAGSNPVTIPPFSLSLSAKQAQNKIGESIQLVVSVKNTSENIIYDNVTYSKLGLVRYEFFMTVLDGNGNSPAMTKYYRHQIGQWLPGEQEKDVNDVGGRIDYVPLQPGESVVRDVDVAKFYNIELPGKYQIWVEKIDEKSQIRVKSNTITITVTP